MFYDPDSFLGHTADKEARSIGAILAALPDVAALRRKNAADRVKFVNFRDPAMPSTLALRGELA